MSTKNQILKVSQKTSLHIVLSLLLSSILFLGACKRKEKREDRIYSNPGYARGEITLYFSGPFRTTVFYSYEVEETLYSNRERTKRTGSDDTRWLTYDYLVVYNTDEPSESDINFDYYITDEEHFQEMLQEFEDFPPSP